MQRCYVYVSAYAFYRIVRCGVVCYGMVEHSIEHHAMTMIWYVMVRSWYGMMMMMRYVKGVVWCGTRA